MSTRAATVEDLLGALSTLPGLTARKMFGEYALYLQGRVVALVCDDLLYAKPTPGALALVAAPVMGRPYPGAKDHLCLADALDDPDRTAAILRAVAGDLPPPAPRRPARQAGRA